MAWPALEKIGVTPDVLAAMDAEHDVMAARLGGARGAMAALRSTPTAANAQAAHASMVGSKRPRCSTSTTRRPRSSPTTWPNGTILR